MMKMPGIEYEDYVRIQLYGPSGLKEVLWLWNWREGLRKTPPLWEFGVLREAVGLAFIKPLQQTLDRLTAVLEK